MIPVFITVRDLFDAPRTLAKQVSSLTDGHPVLLDCASTFPMTVAWLESGEFEAHRFENLGNNVAWNSGMVLSAEDHIAKYGHPYFVVTDGDIDLTGCPVDLLVDMARCLDEFPDKLKIGLSLQIGDLPRCNRQRDQIIGHECKFWAHRVQGLSSTLYAAESDTHFCMYRAGSGWGGYDGLRIGHPYIGKHVPWYWNPDNLPIDAKWYVKHMDRQFSTWATKISVDASASPQ